ncbi:TTC37.2 family protein [Megaselia abdita]
MVFCLPFQGEEEKGLTYLVSKVHMYPNRALLRKVLADYLLENFSHMRKYHQSTSQIALSVIALGLKDRKNIQTAKAAAETMLKASAAIKPLDSKKSIIYIQRAIHLNPSCEEAWRMLKSVKC